MAQTTKKKNNKKKRKKKVQILKNNTKSTKKKTNSKNSKKKVSTSKKQNLNKNQKTKKKTTQIKKSSINKNNKDKKVKEKKTASPKEVVVENKKNQSLKSSTRKKLIFIAIICLVIAMLLLFPYGTREYVSEASGKILEVPKFSKLSEECCNYEASFTSLRSYAVLKKELQQVLDSYEVLNCDNKKYYYNTKEDFTITNYKLERGLFLNKFSISYGAGNSCEINTSLKNIELLPSDYSISDAKRDGSYVIENGNIYNEESYTEFLNNVENKVPSTLRIASLTTEGDLILTDLKYLETGKYKIIYDGTRDRYNKDDDRVMMAYFYDHLGIYKNKLYAYNGEKITNGSVNTSDVYYLFDIKE